MGEFWPWLVRYRFRATPPYRTRLLAWSVGVARLTFAHLYWQVTDDLAFTATEKAACTSINAAMAVGRCKKLSAEQVTQRGLRTRIYLRHPITRFQYMFAYFAPNDNYPIQPSRAAWELEKYLTIEQFIDAVLDKGIAARITNG